MRYYTTRAFPTASRQYEAGDAIDPANITAAEWIRGTESGAVVPARWYGTAAELAARGIPGPGVPVYETDTKIARVGDGTTAVASLPQVGMNTYARVTDLSSQLGTTQADGTTNAATINAAILASSTAGGGIVSVTTPGTYYLADHILMRSNVTLRILRGVTLRKVDGATGNVCMIRNANPSTTAPYTDVNMTLDGGGIIDGNQGNNLSNLVQADQAGATTNTLLYGIQGETAWIGVTGLAIRDITFYDCNGFAMQLLGDGITVDGCIGNTMRDFVHVNGPSSAVRLRNLRGNSNDDFIALNAWDWHRSAPSVGDIQDVRIDNVQFNGTSGLHSSSNVGALLKMLPGTRSTGVGTGTGNVRNVVATNLRSSGHGQLKIISDYDQVATEVSGAGTIENIRIDGLRITTTSTTPCVWIAKQVSGSPVDAETSLTLRNVVISNGRFDCDTDTGFIGVQVNYPQTILAMQGVVFRDCAWVPSATASCTFMQVLSKSVLDSIEIDGLVYLGNAVNTSSAFRIDDYSGSNASELKSLGIHRVVTAPGVTVDSPIVAAGSIIDWLSARDWQITFTGGSGDNHGINFSNAQAQIKGGILSGLNLTNPKEVITVRAGATGSVICSLTVRDANIVGCTHPIFIQGSRQATIVFRGGNIDTPNNLARVDTSTLTLTLDGTTSSGAGASTITQVSTTTLRVPRADRIALALGTLTTTPSDGDQVYSSNTPTSVVSGTGAGVYVYRAASGWVKLN